MPNAPRRRPSIPVGAGGAGLVAALALLAAAPSAGAQAACLPILCPAPAPTPTQTTPAPTTTTPSPGPGDPAPRPVPDGSPSQVTSYVDPQHTSYSNDPDLAPPLVQAWATRLDGDVAEAVGGDGILVVRVVDGGIRAFDAATGRPRWTAPSRTGPLAYDAGRVFVADDDELVALSAADGHELWRTSDGAGARGITTPVATAGRVYYGTEAGSGSMVARDAATGRRLWTAEGEGTANTPTVTGPLVLGSYACGLTVGWRRPTGLRAWATTSNCSGGGGSTATAYGGRLYVPEDGSILDVATGGKVGTGPDPQGGNGVFAAGLAVVVQRTDESTGRRIRAFDLASGRTVWTRKLPATDTSGATTNGDPSRLVGGGGVVYTVRDGDLLGYDLRTGAQVVRGPVGVGGGGFVAPLGSGRLLTAGGRVMRAFHPALRPAAGDAAVVASPTDIDFRRSTRLLGRLGTTLAAGRPSVIVEGDAAPAGGGYRRLATVRAGADGRFSATLRPDRNTRVRVRVAGRTASAGTVYVYPAIRVRTSGAGRTRFRVRYRIRGPRSVRLRGRRAVVYLARPSKKRFLRIGSGRLRRVGAGVHGGSITARRRRSVGRRDYLTICVPGAARLGLGRPDLLQRRCGRSQVPLR